jgi:hypothetical protein
MNARQITRALEQQQCFDSNKRAENKNLAMGKVDELQNAIDHRIA